MKRLWIWTIVTASLLVILGVPSLSQTSSNLLANANFEGSFTELEGEKPRKVANNWKPWHIPRPDGSPAYANHAPFYDEETVRTRGDTAGKSQVYFNQYATHQGGVYQQVSGLTIDSEYRFSIYAWVWSSIGQDWSVSEQPGNVSVRVGIDPAGGVDASHKDIIWSTTAVFLYNAFYQYSVIAKAESQTITVFVESNIGEPVANNYIYLDDAVLELVTQDDDGSNATPTSESGGELASATPTQEATGIVKPSDTPSPTPVSEQAGGGIASEITATPAATSDMTEPPATSEATETALPSETATATSEATATATASDGATPTPTPFSEEFPYVREHVVQDGDTVSGIALQYGSSVDAIRRANDLNEASLIKVGQTLIVPVNLPDWTATPTATATSTPTDTLTPTNTPTPTSTPSPTATPVTHTVQAGDTLGEIATRYGVPISVIARLNNLSSVHEIDVGQVLLIPSPTPTPTATPTATDLPPSNTPEPATPTATAAPGQYIVQAGDTLDSIATAHNTTVAAIVQLNSIDNPSLIYPGQVLQVPGASSQVEQPAATNTATAAPSPTPLPTARPTTYTVQSGDTLFQIAQRFGVSVVELAALNNIVDYNSITAGDTLTIPG